MDKESINNRFLLAIDALLTKEKVNKAAIAASLQIKANKFTEILGKRMKAGLDTVALLCYNYQISTRWILLGEGSMFLADGATTPPLAERNNLNTLVDKLIEQAEEIGRLRQQLAAITQGNNDL